MRYFLRKTCFYGLPPLLGRGERGEDFKRERREK